MQFGLAYGVANTRGQVPAGEAAAMLAFARASGVDTLDTAIAYGDSESRLGVLASDDWRVVTKLPPMPADVVDVRTWVRSQCRESLNRLRRPRVAGLLLHAPLQLVEPRGAALWDALCGVRDDGWVERIGASVYSPLELAALMPRFPLELVQAPMNVVDRRLALSGWLSRLAEAGVEVHVRSAFLQGLLLMAPSARPEYFQRWSAVWTRWHNWLDEQGVTALHACLAFLRGIDGVSRIVVGADSLPHLEAIVAAMGAPDVAVPSDLASDDDALVNPARWPRA